LPKRKFAIRVAPDGGPRGEQAGAEVSFDAPPAPNEIGVFLRQSENCVKMIRQYHNRINGKGALLPGSAKRRAELADMIDKSCRSPVFEPQREEVDSSLNVVAPVSDHSGIPVFASPIRATC
jgi:hypothetical protein